MADSNNSLPTVRSIGISIWDPVWAVRDHVSTSHEIVHIMEGSLILHIGKQKFKGKTGDTFIIPSGIKHRDEFPLDNPFKVLHVQFTLEDNTDILKPSFNSRLADLSKADKEELKEVILCLYKTFQKNRKHSEQRTALQLADILYLLSELTSEKESEGTGKKEEFIQAIKDYITDNLKDYISLKHIADHLKLSEYYVSHLFSEETGFSFSSYLTKVRMEHAAELLTDPTTRVSEAAYESGYEDPNYFGKVFRKYFGVSPGKYREGK